MVDFTPKSTEQKIGNGTFRIEILANYYDY